MIQEDYCSFEVARLLKDKGFDVPFFFYYRTDDEVKNKLMYYDLELKVVRIYVSLIEENGNNI